MFNSKMIHLSLFMAFCAFFPTIDAQGADCPAAQTARYTVTFDAVWSAQTHPQDFPSNPHFSGLVGGTHNDQAVIWEVGSLATDGMESMAETGSKTILLSEVNDLINQGTAESTISGPGIGNSPGSASVTIDVTQDYPLVSLVTMIAPSPDWFVGVSGLSLFDGNDWVEELVVPLKPYDAGTDSGAMYTSPNMNTNPAEPIFEITGYPFLNNGMVPPLGTFTFSRVHEDCLSLCVTDLVAGQAATFHVSRGTPGERVVILYGIFPGQWNFSGFGWNVAFDFAVPPQSLMSRIVGLGDFDQIGEYSISVPVPAHLSGLAIKFQAAEKNSGLDPCMSNLLDEVIQ